MNAPNKGIRNSYTLTIPFTTEEEKRFHNFTKGKGLKKGVFAKKAILRYMEEFAPNSNIIEIRGGDR